MTKKHFRLEVCCRIVEVDSKPGRPAMGSMSIVAKQEELTRMFLVSKHPTKEAAQAALLGTAVGSAFGPALQEE